MTLASQNNFFKPLNVNDMEKIQFILSIFLFVCAAIGVINALFVYANTNIAVVAILCLMCYCTIQLVKISYKELKS